jgi:hypothetical protein
VSVDIQGSEVVVPYVKNTTFKTVVDTENVLANMFGFKIVPNGIFLDKEGTIRLIKQGFSVSNPEHISGVESLLNGSVDKVILEDTYYAPSSSLSDLEKQLAATKFKLGMEYAKNGDKEKALTELDGALVIDPDNFLIRKQRWYIRHPEKFAPTIDIEWQKVQLEKEKLEEAMNGSGCGPEGCTIPGTETKQ